MRKAQHVLEVVDALPGADDPVGFAPETPTVSFDPRFETSDAFYRIEFPRLMVLARALVGSAYAEDVAQEAMLVAFRQWDSINGVRSPAAYVRGICLHKAVSVVRRRTLERQLLGRVAIRRTPMDEALAEDSDRFWRETRDLPRRQAQAVALRYALDLSVAEIADVLDCAEGTVKAHLHRARNALATRWESTEVPS